MTGIVRFIIICSIATIACKGKNNNSSTPVAENEQHISNIQLTDLNDKPIDLKRYKGKTVFINFWATWCRPCIAEMPSIENAQKLLQNENVLFLLASNEPVTEIQDFRDARKFTFDYARVQNFEELGIQVLPTTYIFNSDGKLVFSEQGYRKWDEKDNILLIRKIASNND